MTLGGAALTSVEKNSRPQLMSQRTSYTGDGQSCSFVQVGYDAMKTVYRGGEREAPHILNLCSIWR
jgi:hypothetical protein